MKSVFLPPNFLELRTLLCIGMLFLFGATAWSQNTLKIHVEGVGSSEGLIRVAVYITDAHFLKEEGVYRTDSAKASKGTTLVSIPDLPTGHYALAVFHDKNGNERLDTNWIGIPKEPFGFSNARAKTFGPPSFKECQFEVRQDASISVQMQ